eukprot:CAMPEP_0194693898 /NCGR_PEP_ID=MMETSP0295-20121207/20864_1 /TAXON_ID=39354 /ORGANISM="Heterosigma akashiwo, Strain CCMP2393" /LENGTH=212 /DNA_ID=CAMNT_0039584985 /DNA_START=190 /DNA_END=826 /DNA_ORIENTATION=-
MMEEGSALKLRSMDGTSQWIFVGGADHCCCNNNSHDAQDQDATVKVPGVVIKEDAFGDSGLYTLKDIKAGEEVFVEMPLLVVEEAADRWPSPITDALKRACQRDQLSRPTCHKMRRTIDIEVLLPALAFASADKRTQAEVLSLFCPKVEHIPSDLMDAVEEAIFNMYQDHQLQQILVDMKEEVCFDVIMISLANIFQLVDEGEEGGGGGTGG